MGRNLEAKLKQSVECYVKNLSDHQAGASEDQEADEAQNEVLLMTLDGGEDALR